MQVPLLVAVRWVGGALARSQPSSSPAGSLWLNERTTMTRCRHRPSPARSLFLLASAIPSCQCCATVLEGCARAIAHLEPVSYTHLTLPTTPYV